MTKRPSKLGDILQLIARGADARTPRFVGLDKAGRVYVKGSEDTYWKITLHMEEVTIDEIKSALAGGEVGK